MVFPFFRGSVLGPFLAYFNSLPYKGLVWGPMGETSKGVTEIIQGVAHLSARRAAFGLGRGKCGLSVETQAARLARGMARDLSVVAARGRAQLLLGRRAHVCGAPPTSSLAAGAEIRARVDARLDREVAEAGLEGFTARRGDSVSGHSGGDRFVSSRQWGS